MSQTEVLHSSTTNDFDFDISRSAPTRNFHHPYNGYNPITQTGRGGVKVTRRIRAWSNANAAISSDMGSTFLQDILASSPLRVTVEPSTAPSLLHQLRNAKEGNFVPASAPVQQAPISRFAAAPSTAIPGKKLRSVDPENPFALAGLPSLHHGAPASHLQAGIQAAFNAANEGVDNAESAFFVADLSVVYEQHQRWLEALPEVQPFYAIKCNPDPYVLRLLAALGAGFDCASNNEIKQVVEVLKSSTHGGCDTSVSERVIFANPCKPLSFLRGSQRMGVDMMTFDNIDELEKIAGVYPKARLVVRILTDDSQSLCQLGIKFGARLDVVPALLKKAKELNLDVIGVSFHVGSGCYDPASAYLDAVHRAKKAFDMGAEAGFKFTLLDVGGGFEDKLFDAAASSLKVAIEECFPRRKEDGVRIIAEPGRFYVSRAFDIATSIIARRAPLLSARDTQPSPPSSVVDGDDGMVLDEELANESNAPLKRVEEAPPVMYYINDGCYGAFNCIIFDHQVVQPYVLYMAGTIDGESEEQLSKCSVWGPTCDSIDCVCPMAELPSALRVGDWLGFGNMGAYTICAASQFNGFEVSKVVYTAGDYTKKESEAVRKVLAEFAAAGTA